MAIKPYKYTVTYKLMITEVQAKSLAKLKDYDVNIAQFIRDAIREKIAKDWPKIKESKQGIRLPF